MAAAEELPELSDQEFHATFAEPVVALELVPEDQLAIVSAARAILATRGGAIEVGELSIQNSYDLGGGTCFHHLVWYGISNIYLVIVASAGRALLGFHRLDLNEKYGLPPAEDPVWCVR